MSRSGYSDDCDYINLWSGAVERAIRGYRGQYLLWRLRDALDAMPVKRLIADVLATEAGEVCALGAVDPQCQADPDDRDAVAKHFNIAPALAAEIAYINDEVHRYHWVRGPFAPLDDGLGDHYQPPLGRNIEETPEERWIRVRQWVDEQIVVGEPEATC
jgi:hypothetical protein